MKVLKGKLNNHNNNPQVDESLVNFDNPELTIDDSVLKYTPKSEFIYNGEQFTKEEIEQMTKEEMIKLILQLQEDKKEAYREIEQFRTKNFKMYIVLRRLEKAGIDIG